MRELRESELSLISGGDAQWTLPTVWTWAPYPSGSGGSGGNSGGINYVIGYHQSGPTGTSSDYADEYDAWMDNIQYNQCGFQESDYPDGVNPTELNLMAWDAYRAIAETVGATNQEAIIPIYRTSSGDLVHGNMLIGPVMPPGTEASMPGLTPAAFTMNAPGELVALIHNHPSSSSGLSESDKQWFVFADSIYLNGIDNDLVMFVGTSYLTTTPNGITGTMHLTAHTDEGSAEVLSNGSTECDS